MVASYRYSQTKADPGEPVATIRVRSLMVPPGIPDFATRGRLVQAGSVALTGRAWAGRLAVERVELSADGGKKWSEAKLGEAVSPYAWRAWSCVWEAKPGHHTLCVRARDSEGNVQPTSQVWNYQGMGNNMAQRVDVVVE